jgi:hypothetical protein
MPECHVLVLASWRSNDKRLVAQRNNLIKFVKEHEADFNQMPFEPWTQPLNEEEQSIRVQVGPSHIYQLRGLLGVQVVDPVGPKSTEVVPYPGLIMPMYLFEKFDSEYECPTAVEVVGQYCHPKGKQSKKYQLVLVGDPTAPGPIVNAAKGLDCFEGQLIHTHPICVVVCYEPAVCRLLTPAPHILFCSVLCALVSECRASL